MEMHKAPVMASIFKVAIYLPFTTHLDLFLIVLSDMRTMSGYSTLIFLKSIATAILTLTSTILSHFHCLLIDRGLVR